MIILRLSIANLRKRKSLAATLLCLSLLAALFLNIGLVMQEASKSAFSLSAAKLHSPDFFLVTAGTSYKTFFEAFLRDDERVSLVEKEEVIYIENTKNSANRLKSGAVIFNKDAERDIGLMHLKKEDPSVPKEKAIYLPMVLENSGVSLGGDYVLTMKRTDYSFQVAGFFETSYMGTAGDAFIKYFVPETAFQLLHESVGAGKALSARLQGDLAKREASDSLKKDFLEATDYYTEIGGLMASASCLAYSDCEDEMEAMLSIPMVVTIAIALIIGIINFILVNFKVKEGIDESMVNIGSLQAMGYTTGQIMASKIAEYAILGAAGSVIGTGISYALMPFALQYGEGIVGIAIPSGFHPVINLLAAVAMILLLVCSAVTAAWKIREISPVTALRKGVRTHHFGQNFFPLHKGREPLLLRLALKNIASNSRQNMITVIAIGLGVFSIGLSVILYSNFGYDTSAVVRMTGIEIADIQIKTLPHTDVASLQKELKGRKEVRKTNLSESYLAKIGKSDVHFIISNDFSKTETLCIVQGDFPEYDNEIVLTSVLLKKLHKKIGDTVSVTVRGITREFLIVGSNMGTNNGGNMGMLRMEGLKRMDPYFMPSGIDIYLKDPSAQKSFMEQLYRTYGVADTYDGEADGKVLLPDEGQGKYAKAKEKAEEQIQKLLDQYGMNEVDYAVMRDGKMILSGNSSSYVIREISSLSEYLEGQLESYAAMMDGIMAMNLFVMLVVMGAVISITIRSLIRKQKVDLGIYKALGFTSKDLVKIICLNFTINAALGAIFGVTACKLAGNQLLRMLFSGIGLDTAKFDVNLWLLLLVGLCTVIYVGGLSIFKAYQVKKITAYELFTE